MGKRRVSAVSCFYVRRMFMIGCSSSVLRYIYRNSHSYFCPYFQSLETISSLFYFLFHLISSFQSTSMLHVTSWIIKPGHLYVQLCDTGCPGLPMLSSVKPGEKNQIKLNYLSGKGLRSMMFSPPALICQLTWKQRWRKEEKLE